MGTTKADQVFRAELVLKADAELGEGALWDSKRNLLLWVDIDKKEVHEYDVLKGIDKKVTLDKKVGTVVPRKSGGLIIAAEGSICSLDMQTGKTELIAKPGISEISETPDMPKNLDMPEIFAATENKSKNKSDNKTENKTENKIKQNCRFNDGKCDPAGRFWAGTMGSDAALYCLNKDRSLNLVLSGIRCSNGIAWTLDKSTMYYIDSPTKEIWAFAFDMATGSISDKRVIVNVPEGYGVADGSTIDEEGMLWVAHWGGSRVCRWNPENGKLLAEIEIPATNVTSCAFGGVNLDTLYITTAKAGLNDMQRENQPLAGAIFKANVGVKGIRNFEYEG